MFEEGPTDESWEETVRSIAREVGRSIERATDKVELNELADAIGVDPDVAREWVDSAAGWLRARAETIGDDLALRVGGAAGTGPVGDPWLAAQPHPLDLPTEEQGLALAALDSGRWAVEPGTKALEVKADGPAPSDALGIVRELHVRDWIAADGEITLTGRHALGRWLDSGTSR
jgi:hypothetical protein